MLYKLFLGAVTVIVSFWVIVLLVWAGPHRNLPQPFQQIELWQPVAPLQKIEKENSSQPVQSKQLEQWRNCSDLTMSGSELYKEYLQYDKLMPSLSLSELYNIAERRHVPYTFLLHHGCNETIKTRLSQEERELNILMHVSGRRRSAELTVKYMTQSIQYANVSSKIILIELDDDSKLEELSLQPLVEYIFVPKTIAHFWGCGDLFPNSLLKNIGYLLPKKAKWIIIHDIDMAVPKEFLINAWSAKKANRWMHTYAKYCHVSEENLKAGVNFHICERSQKRGVGGSLLMESTLFETVGGYDPEFFCGWASEDKMIYDKLRTYSGDPHHALTTLWHMNHSTQPYFGMYNKFGNAVTLFYERASIYILERRAFLKFKNKLLLDQ